MSWPTTLWECVEPVTAAPVLPAVIDPTAARFLRPTGRWSTMSTLRWRLDENFPVDPPTES